MKRILQLDAIRGIAILGTMLIHFSPNTFPGGHVGVNLFFTISGFIIASTVFHSQKNAIFTIRSFYIKRIFRLYPVLLFIVFVFSIANFIRTGSLGETIDRAIPSLFYYANYARSHVNITPFEHTWSLSIEEQFYIVAPVLFVFLNQQKSPKRSSTFWGVLLFVSIIFSIFGASRFVPKDALGFYCSTFFNLRAIIGGVFLASIVERLPKPNKLFSLVIELLFIVLTILVWSKWGDYTSVTWMGWGLSIYLIISMGVIYLSVNKQLLFIGNSILATLGLRAYSLYLWNYPLTVIMHRSHILFIIVVNFVLAEISYRFIEKRFIRIGHKITCADRAQRAHSLDNLSQKTESIQA